MPLALVGIVVLAIVLFAAKGALDETSETSDSSGNDATVRIDPGNENRANQLLGTVGPLRVTSDQLRALDGYFAWRDPFDKLIYYLCDNQYRLVDPVLVKAIMSRESSFNPNAIRHEAGIDDDSIGLMQILTQTAKWVAPFRDLSKPQIKERLYDPVTNISVGIKYIFFQIGRYGRDEAGIHKVIAAYNAGSAKYGATGKFVNQSYVSGVLGRMKIYAADFPPLRTH